MGADNWAVRPKCKKNKQGEADRRDLEVGALYGKITPTEFLEKTKEAAEFRASIEDDLNTFREDYEVGMDEEGTFSVNYRGGCSTCGATYTYKHEGTL